MSDKVAFITGASRGIGACTAVALAEAGYKVALTARTLNAGEGHEHGSVGSNTSPLPGSLSETAQRVQAAGSEALCLRSDILDPDSMAAAWQQAIDHFHHVDLLFNNACYQGPGNMQRLLDVTPQQLHRIYQGNVFTPLQLAQLALPGMVARGRGTVINMVSGSALNEPPAPADEGGWGFAYPSSKAALIRMAGSIKAEHPAAGLKVFNVEPGFVMTEVMRDNGLDDAIAQRFNPTAPETVAKVIRWLAEDEQAIEQMQYAVTFAPQLAAKLGLQ
jgi:NAD(P)-dependent dehydrogenase (short-subunit alcohol dehydrogenase family)